MKLHHIGVVCTSAEHADRPYGKVLGLQQIKTSMLIENLAGQIFRISQTCTILLYGNDNMLIEVFVPQSPTKNRSSFAHLCLEVERREQFARKCHDNALR